MFDFFILSHNVFHRFAFNIRCIQDGNGDIVIHLNPRYNYGGQIRKIVINHYKNGKWIDEHSYDEFDFKLGEQFIIQFLTNPGSTVVNVPFVNISY